MPSVYLCGSITNAAANRRVGDLLVRANFDLFDPCEIVPPNTRKTHFPEHVYLTCRRAIEASDVLFVFLDSYGRDSAWEVGFARGLGKLIIGLAAGSSLFLEDWMIKFALDHVFVLDGTLLSQTLDAPDWQSLHGRCTVSSLEQMPQRLAVALTRSGR
jgi:nucleoside 2-deoxyribosyltransferase